MSWGYRVTILTLSFVCFMTFLVISAVRQDFDLVAEDYYGKELAFQSQIEKQTNQQSLKDSLSCIVTDRMVVIKFPDELIGKKMEGQILFFRPSDAKLDLVRSIVPASNGIQMLDIKLFTKGRYKVQLDYSVEGNKYYCEKKIMIP